MSMLARSLAVLGVCAAAACEPSGPGDLTAAIDAPVPTGALVVEVAGPGITSFRGIGDVRTFYDPPSPGGRAHRVVVVSSSGRALRFRVEVEDVGGVLPVATVLSAVDVSNQPIAPLSGYSVRVAR